MATVDLFSQEWCDEARTVWKERVTPVLKQPEKYSYIVEFGDAERNIICQVKAVRGEVAEWSAGKKYSDEEATFLIDARTEIWKQVGRGQLDPVVAISSGRVKLRKGPMHVIISESKAFTGLIEHFGDIPTNW